MINVAIDGPAGAGKSTVARAAAKELGFIYVDTGALYRAIGLKLIRKGITCEDTAGVEGVLASTELDIRFENGEQVVLLNGTNVNGVIRTEEVGNMASKTSPRQVLRARLVQLQQKLAASEDCVMDGRDIGNAVFPDAELKIFVVASAEIRAQRRYDELKAKGQEASFEEILANVKERDYIDQNREVSPLRQAEDALLLDNSNLTIEEQKQWLAAEFQKAING